MLPEFSERYGIQPWQLDDLTPGELHVYRQHLRARLEQEQRQDG